jgi:hypothetical protein
MEPTNMHKNKVINFKKLFIHTAKFIDNKKITTQPSQAKQSSQVSQAQVSATKITVVS